MDSFTNTNAAILQTQDDISSDSDCSSNSDSEQRGQSIYDLPLVLNALKSSLKFQDKRMHQTYKDTYHRNSNNSNSDDDSSNEEGLYLDAYLDEEHQTPTTSTSLGDKDLCLDSNDRATKHDDSVTANTTSFSTLANNLQLATIDNNIVPNLLPVEEQENQDASVKLAMHYFFENRFMKAKYLLEQYAGSDPLHSLGLSSMLFLKAVMTNDEPIRNECLDALIRTYNLTTAQLEATVKEYSTFFGHSVFQYVQHCYYYFKCGNHHLASHPSRPRTNQHLPSGLQQDGLSPFASNGILRAHVIKAECCLQMAILHLFQGSYSGYIKCGLNIRRAYSSYYFVWQEYQKMGQFHAGHIDKETLSGLQFGIGAVHLILDSLPLNIKRIVSSFGWQPEKQLGMALIHLSKEGDRIRSPWASLLILAYYNIMTSFCPQMLMEDYTQPAIEILLEAQQTYPHSAFFLHFAGRTSRIGRNLALSTQSFLYAIEISKSDWAELDIFYIGSHEIGFNAMMQMEWEEAIKVFDLLCEQGYWSRAVFKYLHGACLAMLGLETDAILQFAQVPQLLSNTTVTNKKDLVDLERYVGQKVRFFENAGYQDCKLSLCALEYVCLMDGVCYMDAGTLENYLGLIEKTLQHIVDLEQLEYRIREKEMDPNTPVPGYIDQRAVLLWMRACIFNATGRHEDAIPHLNWIVDNKNDIKADQWVIPFTFWEAGITAWNRDDRTRGRELWEKASRYKNYSFEGRLSWKIHLALAKAEAQGVPSTQSIHKYRGLSDYSSIQLSYH
ncbi:hypothetical protein BC941DRAFT_451679 [Chlamydoabsidia padenii]|nr:hypothetical protein BC941DRAFT_451679 [Chlamydoabsidia padenii]